jgi:prephenate dehydrogenase
MDSDDSGFFTSARVAVMGLGLMGGSLAMALQGHTAALIGIDPDPEVVRLALERKIVDYASTRPEGLLPTADVVILAAPVNTIIRLLQELPNLHPGPAVVMDLGSTKVEILAAMQALPARFDPIGGHPMCGKEKSGLTNADPSLYQDASFALISLPRTTAHARQMAVHLVQLIGARLLWLDADVHDRWVAATSHLPYLSAAALASITPLEAAPLASTGFRSTARLAASSTEMMVDILMTNRKNILPALRQLREHLDQIDTFLEGEDYTALQILLAQGAERYQEILNLPASQQCAQVCVSM